MKIGEREIGPGHPVFLQAELGVTTMGDVKRSFALIDACADAGLDACKFIVTDPAKVERHPERLFRYATGDGATERPIGDLLRETMFTFDEWVQLRDHCHTRGLIFYATADHLEAVDMLEALQVPAHKVCAWDIAYLPLLRAVAATGKPVLVDIATATMEEVYDAFDEIPDARWFPIHAPHPHAAHDWTLTRLAWPGMHVRGFSSPGRESWCDYVALGLGAVLIEKRVTLRRDEPRGHHHAIALEPDELTAWVKEIRLAEAALREDPWAGSPEAWAERAQNDRQADGLRA